jgi:ribosome-binding factor A
LREVIAEELERWAQTDPRLGMLTVTAVEVDRDLRHAQVWLASLEPETAEALEEERVRLQSVIAAQVRLKRTPQLRFAADPAVATGGRIDEILRDLGLD